MVRSLPRPVAVVGATAITALSALVLDKKYGVSHDLGRIMGDRAFKKRMEARIRQMDNDMTIYRMLELADPHATALWFENRSWTYAELRDEVDHMANILYQRGVREGQFVSIFMTNSPEMVVTIYAVSKLAAVPAYINTALQRDTLAHCIGLAKSKLIICTPDLAPVLHDLRVHCDVDQECLSLNLSSFNPLQMSADDMQTTKLFQIRYEDFRLASMSPPTLPVKRIRTLKDVGSLIYTSGTSGMPKAVVIKNFLLVVVSTPTSADVKNPARYTPLRTFTCLPLFHGTSLFTALYYCVGQSGTLCLARKFSASKFTRQLADSGATRLIYVGELCRYLLMAPPSEYDTAHRCIVASGNGLQRDIWEKFRKRFNIPEIREFYRSTEGVAKFDNYSREKRTTASAGMVGFAGPVMARYESDTYLVKYDPGTEEPYRDPVTGHCVPVAQGEPGEAIGRVRTMDFYNEYLDNPKANAEKLIKDVFEKGDLFQRTGDLLVRTKSGWIRFHDRTGDTYRWRGENVSAGEVRDHIARLANVQDVSVYGIKLAGYDGQAGAASITLAEQGEVAEAAFAANMYQSLRNQGMTVYQVPRLIRFVKQIDTGATFKHAKAELKKKSWDPTAEAEDRMYWLDGEQYSKLDIKAWASISAGKARL